MKFWASVRLTLWKVKNLCDYIYTGIDNFPVAYIHLDWPILQVITYLNSDLGYVI